MNIGNFHVWVCMTSGRTRLKFDALLLECVLSSDWKYRSSTSFTLKVYISSFNKSLWNLKLKMKIQEQNCCETLSKLRVEKRCKKARQSVYPTAQSTRMNNSTCVCGDSGMPTPEQSLVWQGIPIVNDSYPLQRINRIILNIPCDQEQTENFLVSQNYWTPEEETRDMPSLRTSLAHHANNDSTDDSDSPDDEVVELRQDFNSCRVTRPSPTRTNHLWDSEE
ncbi:uncharacterized protein LOC144453479 [Glandiceps talaboti]